MAATATFQAKVDPEKKALVDEIYRNLGTSTAEAFRIFVQKSIDANGFPFPLVLKERPTLETIEAANEADSLSIAFKKQRHSSVQEMMGE